MTENFPNMTTFKTNFCKQLAHQSPSRINTEIHIQLHHSQHVERKKEILQAAREKQFLVHEGIPVRLTVDF